MTLFEFAVPLAALTLAGVGVVFLRAETYIIDARRSGPHRHGR